MANPHARRILTITTGSSSLKAGLDALGVSETVERAARAARIGRADSRLQITAAQGASLVDQPTPLPDAAAALHARLAWFDGHGSGMTFGAVGHRVVHGGRHYIAPQRLTAALIATLQPRGPLAPDHLPQARAAIPATRQAYPAIPQVAGFDTTFHRHMPPVAQHYALPHALWDQGVRRYGFYGLSYESIMDTLRRVDPAAAGGRVIIAHLGNGASMAAVQRGIGVDTTMSLTPTGGLVMGTRAGALDPGVLLYLLHAQGMAPAALNTLVNQRSSLRGRSGSSADMRDLLDQESRDPRAAAAIALFCYQARKFLGALAAVLGGLETLIFTGGIGEHAAPIRARICADMDFLGIQLDDRRNAAHASIIVRGFNEQGTTTTPFDMVVRNGMSRYHRCIEAVRRAPRLHARAPTLIAACTAMIAQATAYAREHLEDMPAIRDWVWTGALVRFQRRGWALRQAQESQLGDRGWGLPGRRVRMHARKPRLFLHWHGIEYQFAWPRAPVTYSNPRRHAKAREGIDRIRKPSRNLA